VVTHRVLWLVVVLRLRHGRLKERLVVSSGLDELLV
jgi:hypothetical protein